MTGTESEQAVLWGEINAQTARIAWAELERHFARGVVIWVASDLDLVEVAVHIVRDEKPAIEQHMASGKVGQLTDEQASDWAGREADLWAVVAAPWVLVQERGAGPV
ncbi:MAG: DUF2288 domain-containing protein [Acidiferrobacterales bacterium]|jgi:hypothetical protein|nr:DUF2288 domain-containing protein [Acidiferrobacterales bacterium]